jgi:hypothetical protein
MTQSNSDMSSLEREVILRLSDYAPDLSRTALLQVLRQHNGNEDAAIQHLCALTFSKPNATLATTDAEGMHWTNSDNISLIADDVKEIDHMCRHGSTEYHVVFEDETEVEEEPPLTPNSAPKPPKKADVEPLGAAPPRRVVIQMGHGGVLANGSWLNEGLSIREHRNWWELADGQINENVEMIDVDIDMGMLSEEDFKVRCNEWLWSSDSSSSGSDGDEGSDRDEGSVASSSVRGGSRSKPGRATSDFKSYISTLLQETPAQRQERIERERMDCILANQLLQEDLNEDEDLRMAIEASLKEFSGKRLAEGKSTPAPPTATASKATEAEEDAHGSSSWKVNPLKAKLKEYEESGVKLTKAERKELKKEMKRAAKTSLMETVTTKMASTMYCYEEYAPSDFKTVRLTLPRVNVIRVENVLSPKHEAAFKAKVQEFKRRKIPVKVEFAYHGTMETIVPLIVKNNFRVPDKSTQHSSGNNGWYGDGVYLSPFPDTAAAYCRGEGKLIVANVIRGRVYTCKGIQMGIPLQNGFDSHCSPCGSEWVFYDNAQLLPVAVIHFNYESHRESISHGFLKTRAELEAQAAELQGEKDKGPQRPQRRGVDECVAQRILKVKRRK